MVFKEDVLQWFRELESYERINLMHELLHMCLPFEIRFLGGCVEEIGKHSFQELRGPSIIANDIDKLSKDTTQFTAGVLDRNCRHRMCIYLSLLENRNYRCAHWYFKQVFRTEQWDEFAMKQKCIDDGLVLNELLMVFTLGRLHPAFNYHQNEFFGDVLEKLYRIRTDKINMVKNTVCVGMPNYPPGFGYPNQIVPSCYVIQYDQSSTPTSHQAPPAQPLNQQQQQSPDTLCLAKTTTSSAAVSSTYSTSSVLSTAGGDVGDLVITSPSPPPLPPGLVQHQQPFQQFEHSYMLRQPPMYNVPYPHMMVPPPQPISPLVSHSTSPPHSRPTSPSANNHSASLQPQQHQHQHRSTSSSLRGSKGLSLDSHSSSQPSRIPNMTSVYANTLPLTALQNEQSVVKIADIESNHIASSDEYSNTLNQQSHPFLQQDWSNQAPLSHLPTHIHPLFAFATHPHHLAPHNAQPPNGLRHCFAANFHPHHHVAIDPVMLAYDFEYQQQQQLNEIHLENSLHQSGSSSNNSSNASSLNESPPDTPVSTPTPALHGPGRGNRDGSITEKLRMLNNVNNLPFMTPPPPPISDGGNMPPQQHVTYNVPYTSLSGGRQMFARIPQTYPNTFSAPPPLTPQQHQHVRATQAQGQPPPYITIGTTGHIMSPNIINSNGNNTVIGTGHSAGCITNAASLRLHHHHHSQHQSAASSISTGTNQSTIAQRQQHTSLNAAVCAGAALASLGSAGACTFCCCNCGSSDHGDAECIAPHIDDIVTQTGYTLAYDNNIVCGSSVGVGSVHPASGVNVATATPSVDGHHRTPDI